MDIDKIDIIQEKPETTYDVKINKQRKTDMEEGK